MNILDTLFGRQQTHGHWVWAGIQQQLHTRTFPQVGCKVCEAEGWIPTSESFPPITPKKGDMRTINQLRADYGFPPLPTPDPDAAKVRLALAAEDIQRGIDNITFAIKDDPRLDEALDIYRERLRGIRAALESEAR